MATLGIIPANGPKSHALSLPLLWCIKSLGVAMVAEVVSEALASIFPVYVEVRG
jgi:hypothetical protein